LEWKIENRNNIIRLAANSSESIKKTKGKKEIVQLKTPRGLDVYAFNGQKILFASNKVKNIDGGEKLGEYVGDLWDDISYNNLHNEGGVDLPNGKKPIALVKRMLQLAAGPNAIVLDFFAGSGTTGHAVVELNKEDGGKRQFILATNDESEICTKICYPRMRNVNKALGLNLKYYVCDFVESEPTDKNKRKLVSESTEMLCIRENAFDMVQDKSDFKIFKNSNIYLGIVFYEEAIGDFKQAIKEMKGHFHTYVFSLGDDPHELQFADIKKKVTLCAIPEVILKVYREIFK
jgi:adenine-specific DNA-methyltransferase